MILAFIIAIASELASEIKTGVQFMVVWIGSAFSGLVVSVGMGFLWPAQAVAITTQAQAIDVALQYLVGGILGIGCGKLARYFGAIKR